jgi:HNH endonuclease
MRLNISLQYWAQHADPDGTDRAADHDRAARRFHLSQSIDGLWFADGTWDPISGSALANELGRLETELCHADWTAAKTRLGHDTTTQHCQVDHIIPHAQGGPTTQTNGRLACDHHNRARHKPPGPDP